MPITPVHLGPALAAKAVTPKHFSFLVFALTQIVIDGEVAFSMLAGKGPVHGVLHTYLGATAVAALTVVLGLPLLSRLIRLWNRLIAPGPGSVFRVGPRVPVVAAASGALVGGYSHVLLDSIVHSDVRPFAPWSEDNALLLLMPPDRLVLVCVGLGAVGGAALAAAFLRSRGYARTE